MVTSIPCLIAKIPDDNDFLKLKEMANVHDDWTLDYDKADIKIWSKSVPDATIKMVKVWSIFSTVNSVDLYNTLMDPVYRQKWDPHMILGFDIGHLNPNNGVSYYAVSCPPPLKSRDFVLQTSWLDRGTEHYIINHSICHKDHPPKRNFIRAISYFTGYFIKCVPYKGCEMSFVSQTDPQGIIPGWVVNKCTQIFAPRFVKQLEKAAVGYREWKSQNNPNFTPWIHPEQLTSPKISISECVPSDEERESQFFKYLVDKSAKSSSIISKVEGRPIQAQFSPIAVAGCSKIEFPTESSSAPVVKNEILKNGSSADPEKTAKHKKSKNRPKLDFSKLCWGKNGGT